MPRFVRTLACVAVGVVAWGALAWGQDAPVARIERVQGPGSVQVGGLADADLLARQADGTLTVGEVVERLTVPNWVHTLVANLEGDGAAPRAWTLAQMAHEVPASERALEESRPAIDALRGLLSVAPAEERARYADAIEAFERGETNLGYARRLLDFLAAGAHLGWRDAGEGELLRAGETVRTGAGVEVVVRGDRGAVTTVRGDTTFTVRARAVEPADVRVAWGKLWRGIVRFYFPPGQDGRPWEVDTPLVTIRTRGTEFDVRHEDGVTRVEVHGGAVDVIDAVAGTTSTVAAGETWVAADGAAAAQPAAPGLVAQAGPAATEGTQPASAVEGTPAHPAAAGDAGLAGEWRVVANGHPGVLRFERGAEGWLGTLDLGGGPETLADVTHDGATLRFVRPLNEYTQAYQGRLERAGDLLRWSGTFDQGGAGAYAWTAERAAGGGVDATAAGLAGGWRLVANGYPGVLSFERDGAGWRGTLDGSEALAEVTYDGATLRFVRPLGGYTQVYQGRLTRIGGVLRWEGTFDQGGAGAYAWTAERPADPAATLAGAWRVDANGYAATLTLEVADGAWRGVLRFDGGDDEELVEVGFDGATLRFVRPLGELTQHFAGVLTLAPSGDGFAGTFGYGVTGPYGWRATRVDPGE